MKIGLIDIDGHNFPNLALMKISAYHKAQGDSVEWAIPMLQYDKVYVSKIFDDSPDIETYPLADVIEKGGRAFDKQKKLPNHIESLYPDYGLYNISNTAYGYLTRGCPWACDFCDVVNIEGRISHKVADLRQFWNGQKEVKLLDPNTLASKDGIELLDQLVESQAWIDFTQGVDIKLINDDVIDRMKKIKIKMLHFAWDGEKHADLIQRNLEYFKKATNIDMRKARVYVLTNFNSTLEFDLYRVYRLKAMGYDPYIMIYNKKHSPKTIKRLQRQVNNKTIWYSGTIETESEMRRMIGA